MFFNANLYEEVISGDHAYDDRYVPPDEDSLGIQSRTVYSWCGFQK